MALSIHDQAQIREYLLGKLSEDEQQKIEERLMLEEDLFNEFEVSKDEVIEEYRTGDLAQNERQWLEQHLLATSEGRERHAFSLAMDCLQGQADPVPALASLPAPAPAPPINVPSIFERLKWFINSQRWATATAGVVVLAVVIGVVMLIKSRSEGRIFEATLTNSSLVRGEASVPPVKLRLPPDTGKLKVRLQLPKTSIPGTRYAVQLDDRINTRDVQIVDSDGQSVSVIIPASLLAPGEYSLLLNAKKPDGTEQEFSYPFNVE